MNALYRLFLFLFLFFVVDKLVYSKEYDINFNKIADGVWYIAGKQEEATDKNGGAIANIGLIVGEKSCLVVDSGPSKKYGIQLIEKIKEITKFPISYLVVTHSHFDHSFGIEAFYNEGIEVIMGKSEFDKYYNIGPKILKILEKNIGIKFTSGTFEYNNKIEITEIKETDKKKTLNLGNREIEIINFSEAHSSGDLVVRDKKTNILFSGDLIFIERAPSSVDANIKKWIQAIKNIKEMNWSILVPGHGPIVKDKNEVIMLLDWLKYLNMLLINASENGDTVAEIVDYEIPEKFKKLKLIKPTVRRDIKKQLNRYNKY